MEKQNKGKKEGENGLISGGLGFFLKQILDEI